MQIVVCALLVVFCHTAVWCSGFNKDDTIAAMTMARCAMHDEGVMAASTTEPCKQVEGPHAEGAGRHAEDGADAPVPVVCGTEKAYDAQAEVLCTTFDFPRLQVRECSPEQLQGRRFEQRVLPVCKRRLPFSHYLCPFCGGMHSTRAFQERMNNGPCRLPGEAAPVPLPPRQERPFRVAPGMAENFCTSAGIPRFDVMGCVPAKVPSPPPSPPPPSPPPLCQRNKVVLDDWCVRCGTVHPKVSFYQQASIQPCGPGYEADPHREGADAHTKERARENISAGTEGELPPKKCDNVERGEAGIFNDKTEKFWIPVSDILYRTSRVVRQDAVKSSQHAGPGSSSDVGSRGPSHVVEKVDVVTEDLLRLLGTQTIKTRFGLIIVPQGPTDGEIKSVAHATSATTMDGALAETAGDEGKKHHTSYQLLEGVAPMPYLGSALCGICGMVQKPHENLERMTAGAGEQKEWWISGSDMRNRVGRQGVSSATEESVGVDSASKSQESPIAGRHLHYCPTYLPSSFCGICHKLPCIYATQPAQQQSENFSLSMGEGRASAGVKGGPGSVGKKTEERALGQEDLQAFWMPGSDLWDVVGRRERLAAARRAKKRQEQKIACAAKNEPSPEDKATFLLRMCRSSKVEQESSCLDFVRRHIVCRVCGLSQGGGVYDPRVVTKVVASGKSPKIRSDKERTDQQTSAFPDSIHMPRFSLRPHSGGVIL